MQHPPVPCQLIHSTTSWATSLKLYYRQQQEQLATPRVVGSCCGGIGNKNTCWPDADVWERVQGMVEAGNVTSVLSGHADVHYSKKPEKDCLATAIGLRHVPEACAAVLGHIARVNESGCFSL